MKINVVHTDLSPCGGAEHVALATIEALIKMDIDVELTTARVPDISKLRIVFGADRITALFNGVKRMNVLNGLPASSTSANVPSDHDTITINTHGDMLPYYLPHFSRSNAMVYCHYPLVSEFARVHDSDYLTYLANLGLVELDTNNSTMNLGTQNEHRSLWLSLHDSYCMMLQNSTILTNSNFSKDAILNVLSSEAPSIEKTTASSANPIMCKPMVVPPPVNVKEFRKAGMYSDEREDLIVVISRFNQGKKLENAISLAYLLKKQGIGKKMIIAGGLIDQDRDYFNRIVRMARANGLQGYVKFATNVTLDVLKSILRKGRVYFHPLAGEPFGIATAEAMSAGLIPVVPEFGGHTDFVPKKYRFISLEDAAYKIFLALSASQQEREEISNMVGSYSEDNYIASIQKVVGSLLSQEQGAKVELDALAMAKQPHRSAAA